MGESDHNFVMEQMNDPLERLVSPEAQRERLQRRGGFATPAGTQRSRSQRRGGCATPAATQSGRPRRHGTAHGSAPGRSMTPLLVYLLLALLFSELLVRGCTITEQFWHSGLWLSLLFALVPAGLVFLLATRFRPWVNRLIVVLYVVLVYILYASQLVYYKVFFQYYTATSAGNAGQGFGFMDTILATVRANVLPLLLLALPLLVLLLGRRRLAVGKRLRPMATVVLAVLLVVVHLGTVALLPVFGRERMSPYDMYYHCYDLKESASRLGLATAFRLDVKWSIFGRPESGDLILPASPTEPRDNREESRPQDVTEETTVPTESAGPPVWSLVDNVTAIDFDALMAAEKDDEIRQMHQYFAAQEPTNKNEKTGLFSGCNLILITAESFSHLALDPEITPTLYKMQTEGFHFTNFYTPIWGVSTSDGEYVALTGTIPKAGVWSFYRSSDNYMPMTMVHQLQELGYSAYGYHNNDYGYYDRELSHPNLGYLYKGMGNGLEAGVTEQWPASDREMIDFTTPDYMGSEPFHAYYMTVSGHKEYNFLGGNAMCLEHQAETENLPYSETVRAYLATQIELDQAMELLLQRLEEAGVAENTVIVLSADHYPYGLTLEEQSELAGHDVEAYFEQMRNACIIYKKGMTPEVVEEPCSSLDLLPTLCNLFGLPYDSRLYIGHDVFSDAQPLIIFQDRGWLTDKAFYNAVSGEFRVLTEETLPADYESTIDGIVHNKFTISAKILDCDYWRILFGEEG